MFERILVPLDGSELSESVLPYAEHLAEEMHSELVLMRVVPSLAQLITMASATSATDVALASEGIEVEMMTEEYEREQADSASYLESLRARLAAKQIKTEVVVVEGRPAECILDYIKRGNVSAVAMSTHGRGGLGRIVFGSVAEEVLRNAPTIPMMLLRQTEEEAATRAA
jgi:nucleotide-binding universal stress UspA family protein